MTAEGLAQTLLGIKGQGPKADWLERLQLPEADWNGLVDALAAQAGGDAEASRESLLAVASLSDRGGNLQLGARARYVAAQNFAASGQLNIALNLIEAARAAFARAGEGREVLRTHVGRITVLAELGRYPEALAVANEVVETITPMENPGPEFERIRCLAWLNMGSCYWHMGAHQPALASFALAEEGFQQLGALHLLPAVANNRGLVLLEMGRVREAKAAFELTAKAALAAQTPLPQGQALANAARASGLLGEFDEALARFAESQVILEGLSVTDVAIILRETADVYLALNLYEEARAAYDDSVRRLREAGARRHLGGALWGMGAWALATGDHAVARQSLAEAVEIFVESDNAISLSGVLLERASLHLTTGDQEAAQADAAQALALVSGADLAAPQAFAHLRMAEALWHAPERAEPHLKQAQFLSGSVGLPHLLFRCQLRAGQLRRRQRRLAEARQSLEEAVNQVERLRGRIPQEAVRASFMGDKAEAYEAWVALLLEMGESDKAFEAAEHAKSRTLVDALNMGGRAKLSAEMSAGQAIHGELMAVYNRLLGSDPSVQSPGMKEQLHKRARDLEAQLQSIAIEFPGRSASGIGADRSGLAPLSAPLPWEKICALLPNGVTLVEYFCAGEEVMAFVGHRGALEVRPQLCKLSQVRALSDRLAVQLQRCETPRRKDPAVQAGLMASCRRVLTELYALLVEPLRPHMEAVRSPEGLGLVVVPHGLLHRLPFHAFCDSDGRYLIDDYEISYAPSATVFGLCAQLEHRSLERAVLVGSHTDVLPSIGLEIDTLRGLMSESVVLRDAGATIDAVRQSGVGHDLLHFASHAIYRTDNPLYSALQLADGWLTAADLLSMPLNGAMVTLSACESGRAHIRGGDELIGFSRAALAAGASTVVVSGWRVDDASTARLMEAFYTQLLAGKGRAAALRSAQLALRSEHPHPWHWAPFSLSGQR